LIHKYLLDHGVAEASDFLLPQPATDRDALLVHGDNWIYKLQTGALTARDELQMEIPYSDELVDAFFLNAGGSILAAQRALEDRICINLGGGFHHAFPDHGEGFCMINDIAIAIRRLQKDKKILRAMTVDCDVHHGNGTAAIFAGDPTVFTLSIHQENNYPSFKPPSDIDIHLADGTGDDDYLAILEKKLIEAFDEFHADLLFYVAGADPYCEDQLGGLSLTIEGLKRRDRVVFEHARRLGIPVASAPAGGYARLTGDTVRIHVNTIVAAREILGRSVSTG